MLAAYNEVVRVAIIFFQVGNNLSQSHLVGVCAVIAFHSFLSMLRLLETRFRHTCRRRALRKHLADLAKTLSTLKAIAVISVMRAANPFRRDNDFQTNKFNEKNVCGWFFFSFDKYMNLFNYFERCLVPLAI